MDTEHRPNRTMLAVTAAAVVVTAAVNFLGVQLPWYLFAGLLAAAVVGILIVRSPFTGIILIAVVLPFERLGAFEFGSTTIRLSQVLLLVTFGVWFLQKVLRRDYAYARNPPLVPLVLFLVAGILPITASLNAGRTVEVFAFVTFTALLLWLIPNIVQTPAQLRRVVSALLLSFVAVVAFGLFQFAGDMVGLPTSVTGLRTLYTKEVLGFTRIQSTAYEPLYFANYLLLPLALLAALFLSGRSTVRAGWLALLFGLGAINLVLTASRGGYLALAGVLFVVGIFSLRRLLSPRNLVLVASIVVIGAMVVFRVLGIGGSAGTNDLFRSHITNVFYGASYQERVETIQTAVQAWREQPVLGLGFGGFGPYAAPHPAYVPEDGWRIVNNEFVELLAENGIVGALLFGLFTLVIITRSVRAIARTRDAYLRAVSVALLAAWVGVLVQYLTFSTLYIVHVWFLLGLIVAVQSMALRDVSTAEPQPAVAGPE